MVRVVFRSLCIICEVITVDLKVVCNKTAERLKSQKFLSPLYVRG
jgi:hypothetical protein